MYFPTAYQEFINKRSYSRFSDKLKGREEWYDSVSRYGDFFRQRVPKSRMDEFNEAMASFLGLRVVGSMRALWTAGPALERENITGFNCAYEVLDTPKRLAELLYILMCGGGVGFSVERQYVSRLPKVPSKIRKVDQEIIFRDSKRGWAEGFNQFLRRLYEGHDFHCNLSKIRPKGERLKTFGGRASGSAPLQQLIEYTRKVFYQGQGRKLNSLEVYDICCYIASIVVVGGVRRSATISLSNFSDRRMASAKDGEFWRHNPQRSLSNNSTAFTERPDPMHFMAEWVNLAKSGSGERGIFNREGAQKLAAAMGRDATIDYGVNPCGEIILRPEEFCNLSEVIVRPEDSIETLKKKVEHAAIFGVLQSTLTDFGFLDKIWQRNCIEERLLGVSLTGLRDHCVLRRDSKQAADWLIQLRRAARGKAYEWGDALGINRPAAITCVKPSGTVSQLMDCASGLHPRFAPYYLRRVRVAATDPMTYFLIDQGLKWEPEVGESRDSCRTVIFEFPIKSPDLSVCKAQTSALEQLHYWRMLQTHWCDHQPSATIYVKPDEWMKVGAWVQANWDFVSGITFLPDDGGIYRLAPYEEITKQEFLEREAAMPGLDFSILNQYEIGDMTAGASELACTGGACEL